ncbi:MAG: calcium/sodium antiporter [Chitinophagales bacterium]
MPESSLLWLLIFVGSLVVLLKASDFFIDAAEKISLFLGVPPFIIGVTIVALGTSLPELVSSIIAVLNNASEIVVSNVVGSNIANTLLVMGTIAVIGRRINLKLNLSTMDIVMFLGSAFLLCITVYDGEFTMVEGILCITGLGIYLFSTFVSGRKIRNLQKEDANYVKPKLDWKVIPILITSGFFIYLAAKYNIESIIVLSTLLNIGTDVIAQSAVAIGTSLPELLVSISAVKKNNAEMAIGNILGSNIFNVFAVMGIPAMIGTLIVPKEVIAFSIPIMIAATILYFYIINNKRVSWKQGVCLLLFYLFFIVKIFL